MLIFMIGFDHKKIITSVKRIGEKITSFVKRWGKLVCKTEMVGLDFSLFLRRFNLGFLMPTHSSPSATLPPSAWSAPTPSASSRPAWASGPPLRPCLLIALPRMMRLSRRVEPMNTASALWPMKCLVSGHPPHRSCSSAASLTAHGLTRFYGTGPIPPPTPMPTAMASVISELMRQVAIHWLHPPPSVPTSAWAEILMEMKRLNLLFGRRSTA